jgi:uncharacterized protein (DUF58 family)
MRGERRSPRRGASIEFRDFRKYELGDDYRRVDWSIFARLEKLMLRQFVEEEDVRIEILIDCSQSMFFGDPITKFDCARRSAAALAFLAVTGLDRVGIAGFDSTLNSKLSAMRGRGQLNTVLKFLDGLGKGAVRADGTESSANPSNPTDLKTVLRSYQRSTPRSGIVFVISDFLDPGDFRMEVKLLAQRGFDVNLIQILAPEELDPTVSGDVMLVDAENGATREVSVSPRVIAAYRTALNEYVASLESFCRRSGVGYAMLPADSAFDEMLLRRLVEGRMTG